MPPAKSKQVIPVPPPTPPSGTSSEGAQRVSTSAAAIVRESPMSESSHSPTTGMIVRSGLPPAASTAA